MEVILHTKTGREEKEKKKKHVYLSCCHLILSNIIFFGGIIIARALYTKTASVSESLKSDWRQ